MTHQRAQERCSLLIGERNYDHSRYQQTHTHTHTHTQEKCWKKFKTDDNSKF
jgi:hypothetical protein